MRRFARALGGTILTGFALTLCSLPATRAQALSLQPSALANGDGHHVAITAQPQPFAAQTGSSLDAGIVLGEGPDWYGGVFVFDVTAALPDFFDATVATVEMPAALREPPADPDAPRVASSQLDSF